MADRATGRARRHSLTQALQARQGTVSPARRLAAAHTAISAAVRDGRLTPAAAVTWARRAGHRQDISALSSLTPVPWVAEANRPVLAHSNQQVLDTLTAILSGGGPDPEGTTDAARDPSLAKLWPPGVWDDGGPGHGAYHPEPLVYEEGNLAQPGHAPNGQVKYRPYASARERITDAEADALYPPRSWPPSQSYRQARAAIEAGRPAYTDEELHDRLFGTTTGPDTG